MFFVGNTLRFFYKNSLLPWKLISHKNGGKYFKCRNKENCLFKGVKIKEQFNLYIK